MNGCLFLLGVLLSFQQSLYSQRFLSIEIGDGGPSQDYSASLVQNKAMGMNATRHFLHWSQLEPDSGTYDFESTFMWAPAFFRQAGLKIIFYINPINTNIKEVPADLKNTAWDDPRMIQRFNRLLDTVVTYLGEETVYFSIGNEVDAYLTSAAEYGRYQYFFEQTAAHLKLLRPDIATGIAVQFGHFLNSIFKVNLIQLHDQADVLIGTYYGIEGDSVPLPEKVEWVMDSVLHLIPGKPVLFSELGYPSSSLLKSSELKQADFISSSFKAWEKHQNEIVFINFFKEWEWTRAEVEVFTKYYGFSDPYFVAFLSTLGLHDTLGVVKAGWDRFVQETRNYGFVTIQPSVNFRPEPVLSFFPSPFTNSVDFKMDLQNFNQPVGLEIYTVAGGVAYSTLLNNQPYFHWNGQSLCAGVYIVSLMCDGQRIHPQRLIKLK